MVIDIDQFRDAAARLADATPLRLRGDGKGLATTTWQRFEIGFYDLFRSRNTIAKQQRETIVAFLAAAREAYGDRGLVLSLSDEIAEDRPLSARAVKATIEQAEARGSHYDTCNKLNIRRAAYGTRTDGPTLPQLLEAGREPVLEMALKAGFINQSQADQFRQQYSHPEDDRNRQYVILEPISQSLELELLKASEIAPDTYRLLEPAEIRQIGTAVIGRRLAADIDPDLWQRYRLEQASQAIGDFADALGECQTREARLTKLLELTARARAIPDWQQIAAKGSESVTNFSALALTNLAANPAGMAKVNTLKQFWSQELKEDEPVRNALMVLANDPKGTGPEMTAELRDLAKRFGPGFYFYLEADLLAMAMVLLDESTP
jgi:hypothetical protein